MLSREQKLDNLLRKRKIDILYDEIIRFSRRVFDAGEQKYTFIASVARATIYLYLIPYCLRLPIYPRRYFRRNFPTYSRFN